MEQNIVDLLKDAFSEVDLDFEDLQSDEGTNPPQTQLVMDEDMEDMNDASKFWTPSDQGSDNTFSDACKQEESDACSDNSESESSNSFTINKESTCYLSDQIDNTQDASMMMTQAQQLNYTVGESTAEEGNMQSDLATGAPTHGLVCAFSSTGDEKQLAEEDRMGTFNVEYQPQTSPSMSSESQTLEETSSESDEELPENLSVSEQSFQCEFVVKEDESNTDQKNSVRDEMKEFTEEDQEQIEESLADYPSDLFHSETEEPAKTGTAQPFTLIDISSGDDPSTDKMEDLSSVEDVNLQTTGSPALDQDSEINCQENEMTSRDLDLPSRRGNFDEYDDNKENFTNDRNTDEDTKNNEVAEELKDLNDQVDYISDNSSDDHSNSQEATNFLSTVNQEEENKYDVQHNYSTEDMLRMANDDEDVYSDTEDEDTAGSEKQDVERLLSRDLQESDFTNTSVASYYEEPDAEPTELHHSRPPVQSETSVKDYIKSSPDLQLSDNGEDITNIMTEIYCSSALLMDGDNMFLDEYDWDVTGEDSLEINSGEGENQEYTEETLEDSDINEEMGERDWEMEKNRIEAFYRFYGDQSEPEDKEGRNHKVTFCLDQEDSEYDEDSCSTEEELDSDLNTSELNTPKPEYHSESDDPLEKPYCTARSRTQPKEQQPVTTAVKQHPTTRNKCLSVIMSALAIGLLTAIGIISFWWATEYLE